MDRIWHQSYDPGVPHTLQYPDQCLPQLVESAAAEFSLRRATEFFGAPLTYRELWQQVLRFATALAAAGVKPQTRVAMMLPNCPQTIIAYHAVLWLGAVAVLTNPLYVEREMEHQWNDAEADVLIVLDHLYPKVAKVVPRTRIRLMIVSSLREYLPRLYRWLYPLKAKKQDLFLDVPYGETVINFSRLIRDASPNPPPCPATLDDLAVLQYTGGTTGTAKGVMLTHRNLLANVMQLCAWVPQVRRGQERLIAILPFFHVFGMTVNMNWALVNAATIILVPKFQVDDFLKLLHRSKPTVFPGVPTIYVALVNHPRLRQYDLSSIQLCITGSAPMPVEIMRAFETLSGSVILEGYGLTESSPVTHVNPVRGKRKPGSIGIPVSDTDARIVQLETGVAEVPIGEVGELTVRGPQVMEGYWRMPEETAAALRDGWLYTGDIARMDEEGYFYIVDRKKDMIITGGYNIYPREIDELLYEHPKILDAVAVGVPDPYRGEIVKVFVVAKSGQKLTEEEVIEFCKSRLAPYKVPKLVEFRESLPKTMVGKILRKELRAEEMRKAEAQKKAD
jgi:long-chain acyl-CoA synthetase